jgi:cytochrome c553
MMRFIALLIALALPVAAGAAGHGKSEAGSGNFGDAAKGERIAGQVCVACHGMDGNSPLSANPNLAGQHPDYLFKQLTEYKSGARANAIMAGMVANLSVEDMRNLAAPTCPSRTCAIWPRFMPATRRSKAQQRTWSWSRQGSNCTGPAFLTKGLPPVPPATRLMVPGCHHNIHAFPDSMQSTPLHNCVLSGPAPATTT